MTVKWDIKGIPHKGWSLKGIDDRGSAEHTCQLCGNTEIRYVHYVEHPSIDREMEVGCVCAGHITGEYSQARQQEKYLRDRNRWLENWHDDEYGIYRKYRKKTYGVYLLDDIWYAHVNADTLLKNFNSIEEAQTALFDKQR